MALQALLAPAAPVEHDRPPAVPGSRVELHVHLDGAPRHDTLWELGRAKAMYQGTSLREFSQSLKIHRPKDLNHFLSKFSIFMPAVVGDLAAIERVAREFCQDACRSGLAYVEARFCPHLLAAPGVAGHAREVVRTVCRTFRDFESNGGGREQRGVFRARVILCCIVGLPDEVNREVLDLCQEFRGQGVVGIDVAGDEATVAMNSAVASGWDTIVTIFQEAKRLGVHRTVHAGEAGPADHVRVAVEQMHAERIGHGYHALDDPKVLDLCRRSAIHFETCPTSSLLTGSLKMGAIGGAGNGPRHPVVSLAMADYHDFSINTDDPTITMTTVADEMELVRSWGLSEVHLVRSTFAAARACFLPDDEKVHLLQHLKKVYGVE